MKSLPILAISIALLAGGCSQESQVSETAPARSEHATTAAPATTTGAQQPSGSEKQGMIDKAKTMGTKALDKSRQVYESAKEKTGEMADKAVEKSKEIYQSAKAKGGEIKEQVVEKSTALYDTAKEEGKEIYQTAKEKAGDMLDESSSGTGQPAVPPVPMEKPQG